MLDAGAPEVVRDAARHADRRARAVPRLLEVAKAGAAVPALVEARSLAGFAVEDERAVRPPPGLLALDHRHQLGRVLGSTGISCSWPVLFSSGRSVRRHTGWPGHGQGALAAGR